MSVIEPEIVYTKEEIAVESKRFQHIKIKHFTNKQLLLTDYKKSVTIFTDFKQGESYYEQT